MHVEFMDNILKIMHYRKNYKMINKLTSIE